MEDHPNCVLDWPLFYQAKSTEELTESLWLTTMELQEEMKTKDEQLNQLKDLLKEAIDERNKAQNKCQWLLRRQFHRQTAGAPPHSGGSSIEDEPSEESIVSSPNTETPVHFPALVVLPEQELGFPGTQNLPEKGKLLEAVMKAGPLLQNLLLAGPLPIWRHPPPPLDTDRIPPPPVVIPSPPPANYPLNQHSLLQITSNSGGFNKRGFSDDSDSSTETKHPRITLNYQ